MNCRSAESHFSAFIEDGLSQEERRLVESHLLGCRRCSAALRELRATVSLVQALPEVAPSPHFEDDLFARIRSGEGLRPDFGEWLRGWIAPLPLRRLAATGAAACAVWVAVVVLHPGRPATTSATAPMALRPAAPAAERPAAPPSPAVNAPEPALLGQGAALAERPTAPADRAARSVAPPATHGAEAASARIARVDRSLARPAPGDSVVEGDRLEPRYQDEYILDQFLLDRTAPGQDPAIVPVNERPDGDVYITF